MRPRILVIAPYMCRGDTASGDLRLQRILEQLVTFATVDFLTPEAEPVGADESRRYWDLLRRMGAALVSPRFTVRLPLWCRGRLRPYDWIFVEFWYHADHIAGDIEAVRAESPEVRIAIDTVDVHFLRERSALERGVLDYGTAAEIAMREQREIATYDRADLVIACSEEDVRALASVCDRPSVVIPNVNLLRPRRSRVRGHSLLFVGGFRHAPNVDAVTWFVEEIFPLIRERVPDVVFRIAGSHVPPEIESLRGSPGIEIVGFVEDTGFWLDETAVSVAPLRYGAGMKGKVTEALSAGVPVVTTSIGSQGLGATSGEHLAIADTAPAFAEAVIAALADPVAAARMGREGQRLIEGICGPDVIGQKLRTAFTCSVKSPPGGCSEAGRRILARIGCGLWLMRGLAGRFVRSASLRYRRLVGGAPALGPSCRSSDRQ